jgi:hypothetical protein
MSIRSSRTFRLAPVAGLVALLCGAVSMTSGCSSDNKSTNESDGGDGGGSSTGGSTGSGNSTGTGGSSAGGSTSSGGSGATCSSPGAPASGPADDHCNGDSGPIVQETGKCVTDTGGTGDAGPEEETPGPWGGTMSADDDCKYDISYTYTPICENTDVTFTLTLKSRSTMKGATGADPELEVLDPDGIPAAEGSQKATETSDGVYKITPIRFNKKGKWTIRFHVFENCSDTPEDSPHGHAAFFINVP